MSFNIDDVIDALKIVKECKDAELHIDTGDLKLSIFKGEAGNNPGRLENFPAPTGQSPMLSATVAPEEPAPKIDMPPAAAAPAAAPASAETAGAEAVSEEGLVPVTANVTSVFYRKPSPDEPPYVEVGDEVQEDSVVCLLEVMKCFRQVTADVRGKVVKICVNDSELVEAGTVMFLIRPE